MLRPLHDPATGALRVAGLISGSGSNLRRILEHRRALASSRGRAPFDVVVVFSDTWNSRAAELGRDFDLPVVVRDIAAFYAARGAPRRDLALRAEYDAATVEALRPFGARVAAYAGYMSIATRPLIDAFLGVNVHPADLAGAALNRDFDCSAAFGADGVGGGPGKALRLDLPTAEGYEKGGVHSTKTAAAMTVVHSPPLSPSAVWVMFWVLMKVRR